MAPSVVSYKFPTSYLNLSLLEKTTSLQENINSDLLNSMREGNPLQLTGIPQRKA